MRKRRNERHGLIARAGALAGALARWLLAKLARRPVDSIAILVAVAASLMIIINAVVLQSGAHPAPYFVNPAPAAAGNAGAHSETSAAPPLRRVDTLYPLAASAATRPNDPIAQLIGRSSRITAVQHALANYGYGQIRPTGILDQPTSAAIERFEREKGLPVTGQVSDRLMSDLSAMVGHPLE